MTPGQAHNVATILQADPLAYRNFGVWWWHVKQELLRNGLDENVLPHLGGFTDRNADAHYADVPEAERDRYAFAEQYSAAVTQPHGKWCRTPGGDPYWLHDEDVEL